MGLIPCVHCGINFMNAQTMEESARLCNNCALRYKKKIYEKGEKMTQEIQLAVTVEKSMAAKIEEFCISENTSFKQLFVLLLTHFFDEREENAIKGDLVTKKTKIKK